jgi:FkbM family methyltransferase
VAATFWAARVLWRLFRYLRNWREVWAAYRASAKLPALHFRCGFQLHHGLGDDPIMLLHTVFANSEYGGLDPRRSQFLVDIGANIGAVTLDHVWRDDDVRVDAYEPDPATCATLENNIRQNGVGSRVRVFREAVTGQDGLVPLWKGTSSVLSSTIRRPAEDGHTIPVAAISLDRAVVRTGADRVAVKIDAEGAEVEMLEHTSEETLAKIDQLVLEYHDSMVPDAGARCLEVLVKAGFTCRRKPFNSHQGILIARRNTIP